MGKKQEKNYLDFIPERNEKFKWELKNNFVVVTVIRNGFFDKIAQKFFNRSKTSEISLDAHGSFVWQCIDGNASVGDIAIKVEEKFGEDEKLYERLIKYILILHNNNFIKYKK